MKSLTVLQGEVRDELSADLISFYANLDALIERWLNRGQTLLEHRPEKKFPLSWLAGATEVALPADFAEFVAIRMDVGMALPKYRIFANKLVFSDPEGAFRDGTGTLDYRSYPPTISGVQASVLPDWGDVAIVYYALYSFYKKLSNSRSDYERYATLTGQNGVDIEELRSLGQDCYDDFQALRNSQPRKPSSTFYNS